MYTYAHSFSETFTPFLPYPLVIFFPFIVILALWSIAIKGYALWHAARNGQKWWFIAILVLNTVGILEIIYLVWFRPTSNNSTPSIPPVAKP